MSNGMAILVLGLWLLGSGVGCLIFWYLIVPYLTKHEERKW